MICWHLKHITMQAAEKGMFKRSTDSEAKVHQEVQEAAHECAFQKVCEVIHKEVLNDQKVIIDILQLYDSALECSPIGQDICRIVTNGDWKRQ